MLHFDDDSFTTFQPGAVNLANRRRGNRQQVKFGEEIIKRLTQFQFHGFADAFGQVGGRGVLQLLQLLGQVAAHHVGARAHELAELDECRTQFGEREADAGLARQPGDRFPGPRAEAVLDKIDVGAGEPVGQAVFAEDRQDLRRAADIAIDMRDGADFEHGV